MKLTEQQYRELGVLASARGPLTRAQINDRAESSGPQTPEDSLCAAGLVKPHELDVEGGLIIVYTITAAGMKALANR